MKSESEDDDDDDELYRSPAWRRCLVISWERYSIAWAGKVGADSALSLSNRDLSHLGSPSSASSSSFLSSLVYITPSISSHRIHL